EIVEALAHHPIISIVDEGDASLKPSAPFRGVMQKPLVSRPVLLTQETERRFHLDDPAVLHAREETIPLQRIGTPEDIANTVTMLLSDEARFINGQKIVVDGGQYMW
ncbi:MAG TPA: hypothetical protein DEV72_22840, partial [Ktedonobacter sp.]|nr:hypothetical protein [Ktedonobacter sp.]